MLIAAVATRISLLRSQCAYSWIAEQLAHVVAVQPRCTATELMAAGPSLMIQLHVDRLTLSLNEQLMCDNAEFGTTFL